MLIKNASQFSRAVGKVAFLVLIAKLQPPTLVLRHRVAADFQLHFPRSLPRCLVYYLFRRVWVYCLCSSSCAGLVFLSLRMQGTSLRDAKVVMYGAGSSAVGVSKYLVRCAPAPSTHDGLSSTSSASSSSFKPPCCNRTASVTEVGEVAQASHDFQRNPRYKLLWDTSFSRQGPRRLNA